MTAWECDRCKIIYSDSEADANASRCQDSWCGGELRQVEVVYDAEGLRIVEIGEQK